MNRDHTSFPIHTSDYVDSDKHFNSIVAGLADQREPVQQTPTAASFLKSLRITRITSSTTLELYSEGCAICTDCFAVNDKAMRLPCRHAYHKDCIVEWLDRRNTCPLCRLELPEEEEDAPEQRLKRMILRRRRRYLDLIRSGFARMETSPPVVNPMETLSTR